MSYYSKRKNSEQTGITKGRALLGVLMLVVLVGGFAARDTLRSAFFEARPSIDVTGEWLGIVTEDYGIELRYEYRLTFTQNADGSIAGQMHVDSSDSNLSYDIVADSLVSGSIKNDTVNFHEIRVTYLEGVPRSNWCMIDATLDHEIINGQETMTGTWTGIETPGVSSCAGIDGRVILTREP